MPELLADAATVGQNTFESAHSALLSAVVPRTSTQELRDDISRRAVEARDALPITSRARDLYDSIVREIRRIDASSRAEDADDTAE